MKKIIIAAFAAVCSIFSACADNDRIITFDQLPAAALPQALIVEWGKSEWGWKAELNNKIEINFDRNLQMRGLDD